MPGSIRERVADISRRLVEAIGLERMTFNIEYFWDPSTDAVTLLKINSRHSQSHAKLFEHVDGVASHQVMLRLALGRDPSSRSARAGTRWRPSDSCGGSPTGSCAGIRTLRRRFRRIWRSAPPGAELAAALAGIESSRLTGFDAVECCEPSTASSRTPRRGS